MMMMIVLVVAAMASAQTTGQETCDETALECRPEANAFRLTLHKEMKLEMLETADKMSGKCGVEWSTYGTCCRVDQLISLIAQDRAKINQSVAIIIEENERMYDFVKNHFLVEIKSVLAKAKSNWNSQSIAAQQDLTEVQKILDARIFAFIDYPDADLSREIFKQELPSCWNYQSDLRSSAVCSTCSTNSVHYFKGDLGIASSDICDTLIDKCASAVLDMNRLIFAMVKILTNQRLFARIGVKINSIEKIDLAFFNAYRQYLREALRFSLLKKKGDLIKMLKDDKDKKLKYCSHLVRLNLASTPYIVSFAATFRPGIEWSISSVQENVSGRQLSDSFPIDCDSNSHFDEDTMFMSRSLSSLSTAINYNYQATRDITFMNLKDLTF